MIINCMHCDAPVPLRRIRRGARYCSIKCYHAAAYLRTHQSCRTTGTSGRSISKGYVYWIFGRFPQIAEHRVLIEQHIGRELLPTELVHHRNGIKDDNRIENLEIMSRSRHSQLHYRGQPRALRYNMW